MASYKKGDTFYINEPLKEEVGYPRHRTLLADQTVTITKITKDSVWVRGKISSTWGIETRTIEITHETAEELFSGTPPRKLGTVPEGMISPDDPRLAWLWEDAAKLATRSGHCSEYDRICDALGIPGRERDFKVSRTINGFQVEKTYKARSKKQAEEMFEREIAIITKENN